MAIDKYGYSAESLQKRRMKNLKKNWNHKTNLINIKLNDLSDKLEKFNTLQNVQELNFDDGETKVVVNAKFFLGIYKDTAKLASQIEGKKIN